MGSTRLPGKAMADLGGKPLLAHAIEILSAEPRIRQVVLCTTPLPQDDVLVNLAQTMGVESYRGSECNVLDRFYQASLRFADAIYFRATGDNPLIDPAGMARILPLLRSGNWDYVCEADMPLGAVVEGMTADCLKRSWEQARNPEDLEHVTLFCKRSGLFRCHYPPAPEDRCGPELRLTVDTPMDLERAQRLVLGGYGSPKGDFAAMVRTLRQWRAD